jgi:uncharacterized membrane protein
VASEDQPHIPGQGSTRRIEALGDGVFSIVMTLIVLEVHVPEASSADLAAALLKMAPTLIPYALTFLTLGMLWFGNRTQSEQLRAADHPLVWLNLLFLGLVALIPFSSALLSRYPTDRLALVIYGVHLVAASLAHAISWVYATYRADLVRPEITQRYLHYSRIATFMPAIGYAIATTIGALIPSIALIAFLLVPLPFVTGIYYRVLQRINRQGDPPRAASAT